MQRLCPHFRYEFIWILLIQVLILLGQRLQNIQVLLLRYEIIHTELTVLRTLCDTRLDNDISLVVDDLIQFLRRKTKQVSDFIRQALEVPNVGNRHHQLDVSHALATYFLLRHFDTTSIANNSFVSDSLVFTAMAFKILDRTKNSLTKQAVTLGLVRPIVDGLRFQYFAV